MKKFSKKELPELGSQFKRIFFCGVFITFVVAGLFADIRPKPNMDNYLELKALMEQAKIVAYETAGKNSSFRRLMDSDTVHMYYDVNNQKVVSGARASLDGDTMLVRDDMYYTIEEMASNFRHEEDHFEKYSKAPELGGLLPPILGMLCRQLLEVGGAWEGGECADALFPENAPARPAGMDDQAYKNWLYKETFLGVLANRHYLNKAFELVQYSYDVVEKTKYISLPHAMADGVEDLFGTDEAALQTFKAYYNIVFAPPEGIEAPFTAEETIEIFKEIIKEYDKERAAAGLTTVAELEEQRINSPAKAAAMEGTSGKPSIALPRLTEYEIAKVRDLLKAAALAEGKQNPEVVLQASMFSDGGRH